MTRKKNKVTPLGYHGNSNQSSSPKSDGKHAKLGKGSWKKIVTFFSQFICTEHRVVEAFHSQGKVVSMYGELSDSDHQKSPASPSVKPKQYEQPEFKEVVFTLPDEQTTNTREAKLTVPITALAKPTECNHTKEQRTNAEILQDLSANGLVGDVQPSMILESVKPGGVSFEIRMTTVRPKTAKGQRVPRPPRRLESLEVDAVHKRESRMEEISAKIRSKQEKATLQRQFLQETRQKLRHEKSQKIKQAVDAIAAASEKKTEIVERMAEKEERAEAVCQEQQIRISSQDIMKRNSKQLSLEFPNDLSEMSPDDLGLDKISTYNGSDGSDDDNTDYLKSVKREDKYDDFYDGPKEETFMF